jgi:ADP-ribosylglycohydrolase
VAGDLLDGVYGCLIGGAIGDALGAPVENWHYIDVRREHGRVSEFLPQPARARDGAPGQITDDTTLRVCGADVNRCLVEGASVGRDADTIASVLGCLAGALHGAHAIRPDWIDAVERANQDFFTELEGDPQANFRSMAERLVAAIAAERDHARQRLERLTAILD